MALPKSKDDKEESMDELDSQPEERLLCASLKTPFIHTSTTNRLRIEFNSDNSVQKSGFAAIFFTGKLK